LVVQVAQLCGDDPALAVGVGAREHFGYIQVYKEAGFVMDYLGGRGRVGSECRASGKQSGEAEGKQFHGGISRYGLAAGLAVRSQ
jgi:hypothetical protein